MSTVSIFIGASEAHKSRFEIKGEFVEIEGEPFYRIQHYDRMPPFFMSIVSDSDHWLFVSSQGGLTAGRKNPEYALFPYYTVDKIHDSEDLTGSKTLFLVERKGKTYLWEPFSRRYQGIYFCVNSLYKSVYGNKIRFESINKDLGIRFSYTWCTSEQFGFIKYSQVKCIDGESVSIKILDGIQNILHYGIERGLQSERSNLLDAYKKSELDEPTGLGIFALSSLVVDKPIPSEALKATTVWCTGLYPDAYLLSMRQLHRFRLGDKIETELDVRAERGAYFIQHSGDMDEGAQIGWYIVAEINQGPELVISLIDRLASESDLKENLLKDVSRGTNRLKQLVGSADGLQCTADTMTTTRHYANVLFNIMRGGVFDNNTLIDRSDLISTIAHFNRAVGETHDRFLNSLPEQIQIESLLGQAAQQGDRQLERLCYEYLPLIFSRRHGDPSRPWNMFSIDLRNEDGSTKRSYQGNWRDIFQNWEALSLSFPAFLESIISKFVNASTVDGYNPYRITCEGIDWEIMDPSDPWSYIGYWGDHQVIYLLKLLELSRTHHPDLLTYLLTHDVFAYANVPYRIKPYHELIDDPHNTILYDEGEQKRIAERVNEIGADGKLVWDQDQAVYLVNLTEKVLVSVLAKLANFIPGAGIWMNTQRPEWNDANNALVGYGVSMVTLYYLRRFNRFAADLYNELGDASIELSEEVHFLLASIADALSEHKHLLENDISPYHRKEILDALGEAGSAYRMLVYERGFSGRKKDVVATELTQFFELSLTYIEHTIWLNQRADHLFHAYNLMHVKDEKIEVSNLYEMLEGQVAVLSAGILSAQQTVDVLTALKKSNLYRQDQNSYVLYPDRSLARFVEKNKIPPDAIQESPLLSKLIKNRDTHLVVEDVRGDFHFNGNLRDREAVLQVLAHLHTEGYGKEVDSEKERILGLYTAVFGHKEYTGRSGTFFGYEGLGCIYWHMVSKLVLAIKEAYFVFHEQGVDPSLLGQIVDCYYDVRAGVGLNKTPEEYGAFPFDPYSHTPGHVGARQPGMTGQVKEDIISRWGELGVVVQKGKIQINPVLLRSEEFLTSSDTFSYFDVFGVERELELGAGSLAFTYCQVPFVYRLAGEAKVRIEYVDGRIENVDGLEMSFVTSSSVLNRIGDIRCVFVCLESVL